MNNFYGLRVLGGVLLNAGKLRIVPVEQLLAVRVTAAEMEEYARTRSDWMTCKFCGLQRPDMVALREHQSSCAHPARQENMENPGGPDDGKSWYVRRIKGAVQRCAPPTRDG